jgi:hypothetical protein
MLARLMPLLAASLAGCAHFSDIDAFPRAYRERLARHPVWLTVTSFDNVPGVFPPAETSVVKKWEARAAAGALTLRETASSSFLGLMEAFRGNRPWHESVSLDGAVDPQVFFPFHGHALEKRRRFAADSYSFKAIDGGDGGDGRGGERFEITINDVGRIVFVPAPANSLPATGTQDGRDVGIWTAPFGAEGELVTHLKRLIDKDRADAGGEEEELPKELMPGPFLHHDVTIARKIPIVVDPSFPAALRPAVAASATRWNQALRHDLFETTPKVRKIRHGDCLSGLALCIRWIGRPEVVMTGANGYTELAFDPDTGLIIGGLISVINDDVRPPFRPLAAADKRRFDHPDLDFVVDAIHRYGEMENVLHPLPEKYLEYLLTHEMGHFNGLGHNFYTSAATSAVRPVSSVMSYPPFPVAHRANYVGEADLRRLELVYGRAGALPPSAAADDFAYCSTFDAMAPERSAHGFYTKTAACDMFTVGDAAAWYIRLAERGRLGVFTPFPDISNLSEELQLVYRRIAQARGIPPLNVLTRLGFVLADKSDANAARRQRVTAFLCKQTKARTAIGAQLLAFHGLTLACPRAVEAH